MTKYILHGGETGIPNEHNRAFYQEWVKDFQVGFVPTILLVNFSREKAEWPKLEQQDKERFAKYTSDREVNFVVAGDSVDTLRAQIKVADVIYARGGSLDKLKQALAPLKDEFVQLIQGKVYAGSSAGVMVLAHHTCSTGSDWRQGLGLLPINAFVHWNESLSESLELFKKEHTDNAYEYLLIPETEFVVKTY